MHIDHIVGICNLYACRKRFNAVVFEALQNSLATPNQHNVQLFFLCRLNRAQRDRVGGVVAAHDVYNNPHPVSSFG